MSLLRVVFWLAAVSVLMPLPSRTAAAACAQAQTPCGGDKAYPLETVREQLIADLLRVKADLATAREDAARKDPNETDKT
jgi:hypothetical protein